MELVIIIIFAFMLLFIKFGVKDKISFSLILIYTTYWMASLLLCHINPYGFYKVSNGTFFLLIGHVITFLMGFIIVNFRKEHYTRVPKFGIKLDKLLNNIIFVFLFIISFIFVLYLYRRQQAALLIYEMSDIRGDFMGLVLEKSGSAYLFYNLVATGMYHISMLLISYMLFFERRWKLIALFSLYFILYSTLGGGRNSFITLGYYLLGMIILSDWIYSVKLRNKVKYIIPFKLKIALGFFVSFFILIMSYVSALRNGADQNFSKETIQAGLKELSTNVAEYSVGPIVGFDVAMTRRSNWQNKMHYGTATISGTDYFFYMMLYRYGLHQNTSYHTTTNVLQNDYLNIGPDRGWNYAYTSCMYYFFDFGIFGVILIPFLLGIITRLLILLLYKRLNLFTIGIFLFLSFCMYMSVFSGYLHKMISIFYMVFLYFMSRNKKFVA